MQSVVGSSPTSGTMAPYSNRQREPAQTRYSTGSSPVGATKYSQEVTVNIERAVVIGILVVLFLIVLKAAGLL